MAKRKKALNYVLAVRHVIKVISVLLEYYEYVSKGS